MSDRYCSFANNSAFNDYSGVFAVDATERAFVLALAGNPSPLIVPRDQGK